MSNNSKRKSPSKIKELIIEEINNNKDFGLLKDELLYMKVAYNNDLLVMILLLLIFFAFLPIVVMILNIPIDRDTSKTIVAFGALGCVLLELIILLFDNYLVYDINKEVFYNTSSFLGFTVYTSKEIETKKIYKIYIYQAYTGKGHQLTDSLYADFYSYDVGLSKYNPASKYHEVMVERAKFFAYCFNVPYEFKKE